MKKLLLTILIFLQAIPAFASFSFVNSGTGGASGSLGTVATGAVASVHVGDSVFLGVKWEGGSTTVTASDGTTSLTQTSDGIKTDANGASVAKFYLLSSVASGSVTYTVTFGANRTFRDIGVLVYTPSAGTVSLDGTPASAIGSGTTINSGNITTTGTDGIAFGWFGETGTGVTVNKINNIAADKIVTVGQVPKSSIWAKSYSAGFTGAATATISNTGWNCGVTAFQNTASVTSHTNTIQGVSTITGVSTLN